MPNEPSDVRGAAEERPGILGLLVTAERSLVTGCARHPISYDGVNLAATWITGAGQYAKGSIMGEFTAPDPKVWEEMVEQGLFPEQCPVCSRVNLRNGPDYCAHYWGTVYDGALIDGPYAEEFEGLWAKLEPIYQSPNDIQALGLIKKLRKAGLDEVARAVVDSNKLWWLRDVKAKILIDAEASMASGTGWSLYHDEHGWFDGIMDHLRLAVEIGDQVVRN